MISIVTNPFVTIDLPGKEKSTGTTVILCPGGAMRFLSWNNDLVIMAKLINERAIAAIGLKYRLRLGG